MNTRRNFFFGIVVLATIGLACLRLVKINKVHQVQEVVVKLYHEQRNTEVYNNTIDIYAMANSYVKKDKQSQLSD